MPEDPPKPQPSGASIGVPVTVAGLSGVLAVALANLDKLTPFLEKFGMNAVIVLTGLGGLMFCFFKLVPAVERLIESHRESSEKLTDNYHFQTQILSRMDERQDADSTKLDELHREIIVKRNPNARISPELRQPTT